MPAGNYVAQEEMVVAHLFWAMVAVEQATVVLAGRAVSGRLLAPDPDSQTVVFELSPGQSLPERALKKGKIVLVKYASLSDEYQFKSQLLEVSPATWRIAIPRDIHRSDRRLVERHESTGTHRNTIQVIKADGAQRMLMVHDVSPAGVGIAFDPQLDTFKEGEVFRGDLYIVGHDAVSVRFEVVSISSLDQGSSHRMMGCRFIGLGFSGCQQIAESLRRDGA